MFRKLMAMETEAARRHSTECAALFEITEAALLEVAGELSHCTPHLPQRFGVCASRFDS